MNKNVLIKPSNQKEIDNFFPTMPHSCKAWSAYYKNDLACIAGVAFTNNIMLAFCQINFELDIPKMTIWRNALLLWENIKGLGISPLYAVADKSLWNAPQFLSRLGFKHVESSARGEVYLWAIR